MWGLWAEADEVLMTFPCVCHYPLAFSLPTAPAAVHGLVCIFYGSNTDPGVMVTGSSPQGKTQVSLVGCPEVVPSVGTGWGSWPVLQGIYSCCKSRSSCSDPVALTSFAHQGLRWSLLIHWPAQLGAEERADIPCYQPGFRGSFATEAGSSVQWCLEGPQKYLLGKYLPVQIQWQWTTMFLVPKDQGHWSCWWSLETSSTDVYVSQVAYGGVQQSLLATAWGNHVICTW